jgi:prepilin-type processing-associated H-X9-DG protein
MADKMGYRPSFLSKALSYGASYNFNLYVIALSQVPGTSYWPGIRADMIRNPSRLVSMGETGALYYSYNSPLPFAGFMYHRDIDRFNLLYVDGHVGYPEVQLPATASTPAYTFVPSN